MLKMQQIKLISKLGLTLIVAITAVSVAVAIQASYYYYNIQAADAQPEPEPPILPGNSVYSETIVDRQVQTQDLAGGAVTTDEIGDGQVQTQDLASGAVVPNVLQVHGTPVSIGPGGLNFARADCPPGTILTGGGYITSWSNVKITASGPGDDNAWHVDGIIESMRPTEYGTIAADALCMRPSP
jgi:hypothetical protein